MPIREILDSQHIVQCRSDQSLKDAAMEMKNRDVGAVVVTENDKPIGIVTDRDIALRSVAEGKDINQTTLKDVMTSPLVTAHEEEGIFKIIDQMKESQCRRIVIVDNQGKAKGLVSSGDLLKLLIQELSMLDGIMTPDQEKIKRTDVA